VLLLRVSHLPSSVVYTRALSGEEPLEGFPHMLEDVPAISHLYGLGRSCASPLGVLRGAVAANTLNPRMSLEPLVERLRFPIRQQLNRDAAL
jgi:hypothetical protein